MNKSLLILLGAVLISGFIFFGNGATEAPQASSEPTNQKVAGANASGNTAPVVEGKQLLKMQASSRGYSPNSFRVKVGVPVRWEITDTGTGGCTNAVIAPELFEGQIALTPGQVSVKEFTPSKAGTYIFSCWMGMITGRIEVVN